MLGQIGDVQWYYLFIPGKPEQQRKLVSQSVVARKLPKCSPPRRGRGLCAGGTDSSKGELFFNGFIARITGLEFFGHIRGV
eukprot:3628883-Prorocentrum_lima.AAC.1